MTPARKLSDELFRFSSHDDQLLLAVTLCLTERQHVTSHPVIGITSEDLWCWLETRTGKSGGHPNVDYGWKSIRAVQAALRRLHERGLLRGTPDDDEVSRALLWRPTPRAGDYLAERRLFAE